MIQREELTTVQAIAILEEFKVIDDWTAVHLPQMEYAVDMAIEALQAKTDTAHRGDTIFRKDVLDVLAEKHSEFVTIEREALIEELEDRVESLPSAEPKTGKWIPIKWHEITDEEREREGYPKDWVVYIDCDMPNDGDEILVQTKNGYIRWDVCYEEGEFSLDSGWDWIEDIVAWMPLPEPWKDGEE